MKRAIFVTGHYLLSKRRAGFHWLADALWSQGWHVTFFTANFSRLNHLKRDHRFDYGLPAKSHVVEVVDDRRVSFIWYTPWHPANRLPAVLQTLTTPLFRGYGDLPLGAGEELVRSADLVVFESTSGLMLYDRFRNLNPGARYVYRVSDDLQMLRAHRLVVATEERIAPGFDLVSVPSEYILRRFDGLPNARLQYHGIDTSQFENPGPSPYDPRWETNAVFVGSWEFDVGFIDVATREFPTWGFHVVGPIRGLPSRPNLVATGEIPLRGHDSLHHPCRHRAAEPRYFPGAEAFTDSLKVIQYSYCRLPIVRPTFLASSRPNAFLVRARRPRQHPGVAGARPRVGPLVARR